MTLKKTINRQADMELLRLSFHLVLFVAMTVLAGLNKDSGSDLFFFSAAFFIATGVEALWEALSFLWYLIRQKLDTSILWPSQFDAPLFLLAILVGFVWGVISFVAMLNVSLGVPFGLGLVVGALAYRSGYGAACAQRKLYARKSDL